MCADVVVLQVDYVEPWLAGNARGPSTAFCLLYRLFELKPTEEEVEATITHEDSPYIRAVGAELTYLMLHFSLCQFEHVRCDSCMTQQWLVRDKSPIRLPGLVSVKFFLAADNSWVTCAWCGGLCVACAGWVPVPALCCRPAQAVELAGTPL